MHEVTRIHTEGSIMRHRKERTHTTSLLDRTMSELENGGDTGLGAKVFANVIRVGLLFVSIVIVGPFWAVAKGVSYLRSRFGTRNADTTSRTSAP